MLRLKERNVKKFVREYLVRNDYWVQVSCQHLEFYNTKFDSIYPLDIFIYFYAKGVWMQNWHWPLYGKSIKRMEICLFAYEHDLIFPNRAGQPMNSSNMVNRYYSPVQDKAKIPWIKFHALRHTTASIMIEQGENIKYIQSQLGHSSPTVTLNVYAHLMKPTNQEAVCRLESTIFDTKW